MVPGHIGAFANALVLMLVFVSGVHGRNLQYAVAPSPSAAVESVAGLAGGNCYNNGRDLPYIDTRFIGPVRTALVNQTSIAYRRFGPLSASLPPQKPMVLVIGIGLTMHDWTPRFLKALAASRELVILDSPGIGMSTIQPGAAPAADDYFKFQASSVVGLIAALGLQQPDVLGWSLGAKTALHIGVYHGGSVRKIVADAGSAGGNTSSTAVLDGFDGDMSVAQRLQSFGALLERPSNLHALCGWLLERSVMPKDPADVGSIKEQLEAEQAYQDGQGIVPLLPTIHNPTLVITATNDMTNPPSNQVPVVAGIANAALVTFQGCGHLALFQAVDAFVSLVDAFTSAQGVFVPHTDSYYICEGTS